MTTRAAIYCRISDDPEETEAGVSRQEADCREICERHGWTVASVYVDNGVSASQPMDRRPGFMDMLEDAEHGRFDAIVAWRDDRLWRNPEHQRTVFALCREVGITSVVASGQSYDPTSVDDNFMAGIRALFAEFETAQGSLRIRRALRQKAEAGEFPTGGPRRFGYTRDGDIIQHERDLALEAADRILNQGQTPGEIVRDWNARNEPTATHDPTACQSDDHTDCTSWSRTALRRVMISHTLAGLRIHQGQVVAEGTWEPILTPDQRDRLERRLTKKNSSGGGPAKHLLMGYARANEALLYCGREDCGRPMRSHYSHGYRKYVCKDDGNGSGCNRISVSAPRIEEEVRERIDVALDSDALTRSLAERYASDDDRERSRLIEELDGLHQRWEQLTEDLADPEVDHQATRQALSSLNTRKRDVQEQIAALEEDDAVRNLVSGVAALRDLWRSDDMDAKRKVIRSLLRRIEVHPTSLKGRNFDKERVKTYWRV